MRAWPPLRSWVSEASNNDIEGNTAKGFLGVYNTKNSVSKNNQFSDSWISTDTSVTVESNHADYDLEVYYSTNSSFVKNDAGRLYMSSETDAHVTNNKIDVVRPFVLFFSLLTVPDYA